MPERLAGTALGSTESGARYLKIHYSTDPSKTREWADRERRAFGSLRDWDREMEMSEEVYEGEPVFPEFVKRHAPARWRERSCPIFEDTDLFGGWDNTGLMPAFVLAQRIKESEDHPFGGMLIFSGEVCAMTATSMSQFAPLVVEYLEKRLPGRWVDVQHVCDPAGSARSASDLTSTIDVMKKHGISARQCDTNSLELRRDAMLWVLTDWISQIGPEEEWIPRSYFSEKDCPMLVEGMRGAYCYQLNRGITEPGPSDRRGIPAKNIFSHINDASQYLARLIHKQFAQAKRSASKGYVNV